MSSTPYLDKLIDTSTRLNKACAYGSRNLVVQAEMDLAVDSINLHLANIRSQRSLGSGIGCLETMAHTMMIFFRDSYGDLMKHLDKEEAEEKMKKEEEEKAEKMKKEAEEEEKKKMVTLIADQKKALGEFMETAKKTLDAFTTLKIDMKQVGEQIEKQKVEAEGRVWELNEDLNRLEALRVDDQEEIRRLKRVRCKMCRKNSKLTEENEELKCENLEFSKEISKSAQYIDVLTGRAESAEMERDVLKENQEKYNKMNLQPTVEQQITKINERLRAAKTNQERELVFYDLKKNPPLFHEWLRIHGNGQNSNMIAQAPAPQLQNPQQQKFQQQQQYEQQHLQLQRQMQQLHLQRLQQIQQPQQMEQQAGGMGDSNFASTPNCNQSRNTFGYFDD